MMKIRVTFILLLPFSVPIAYVHAETSTDYLTSVKSGIGQLFTPKPAEDVNKASIRSFSHFQLDTSQVQELPQVTPAIGANAARQKPFSGYATSLNFNEAVLAALQRRPEITQSIAAVAAQSAYIDVAKAQYYPQLSGGIGIGDLTSGERGRQVLSLSATQMLYDFGKVKTSVNVEQAKRLQEQAKVLVTLDNIAYQVADAIVNIKRYQDIVLIANQQIKGIGRIAEIANLRAKAGISSQADPIQAQSNLEAAQSNLIIQQTYLGQYQQKLRTLLGYDISAIHWQIPERLVKDSELYRDPKFNQIPSMMVEQVGVEIAKLQKQKTKLSNYPTLNVKGSLSQALNGRNPNNNEDDGFYNSIMLEASSNFYQGGAVASQTRAASYAEEAAKAQVNTTYLEVLDQIRLIREEIENKQKQIGVLAARKETTIRTKELYQEQYKLGTRTVVDLLNAEQAIHSAAQEIEAARYDIYSAIVRYIRVTGRSRDLYDLNNISIQGFEVQP